MAYALDITGIDPVTKNLIFERFLIVTLYHARFRYWFLISSRVYFATPVTAMVVSMLLRLLLTRPWSQASQLRDIFKRYGVPEYELTAIFEK